MPQNTPSDFRILGFKRLTTTYDPHSPRDQVVTKYMVEINSEGNTETEVHENYWSPRDAAKLEAHWERVKNSTRMRPTSPDFYYEHWIFYQALRKKSENVYLASKHREDLVFTSSDEVAQYLADLTGQRVMVPSVDENGVTLP